MIRSGAAITVAVKAADLQEFASSLIRGGRRMEAQLREERELQEKSTRRLSISEVCEQLNVTPTTLWRWKRSGYLKPHCRIGRFDFYLQGQIDELCKLREAKETI